MITHHICGRRYLSLSSRALSVSLTSVLLAGLAFSMPSPAKAAGSGDDVGIMYTATDSEGGRELRLINPNGGDVETLPIPNPGWTSLVHPSGAIASQTDPDDRLRWFLHDREGNVLADLGTHQLQSFSADGEQALVRVVTNQAMGQGELAVQDLETGHVERLGFEWPANASSYGDTAVFTPDESKIIVRRVETVDFASRTIIYSINRDGSGARKLVEGASHPNVSPDGERLVFVKHADDWPFYRSWLVVADVDGSDQQKLVECASCAFGTPSFSPDGSRILYERKEPNLEGASIRVLDLASGVDEAVASLDPRNLANPRWLPVPSPFAVELDGYESGPDTVTLELGLLNSSADGAVTALEYPGGPTAGLVENTAPYEPGDRGAVVLTHGPEPILPDTLGAGSRSDHLYTLDVTEPGNVMLRVDAEGVGPDGRPVSDSTYVEVSATPFVPDEEQREALLAGAYMQLLDELRAEADAQLLESLQLLEKMFAKHGSKRMKRDLNRSKPQEDLLAELYGLPPGSLDFLPDNVRNYLLWSEARSQQEWKAWKGKLGRGVDKTFRDPLEFWTNQIFGSDPATKFQVCREICEYAAEKGEGLESFFGDAAQMLEGEAWDEAWDGMPGLIEEYKDSLSGKIRNAFELGRKRAKQIVRDFKNSNRKGIKSSAEWFAQGEVELSEAVATEAGLNLLGAGVAKRLGRAGKATEEVADAYPTRSGLGQLLPRTIDDGLVPPTAVELGMSVQDQRLIGDVLSELEAKAARMGYPDLELEVGFRARGYSVPGAIGKNQYIKGKTGSEVDLLLGMDEAGLGNNAIFKPTLPKNFADLPANVQTLVQQRFDDQLKTYKQWKAAERGEPSKLSELYKATGPDGNTFRNVLDDGTVTDETFMRLKTKKEGDTTILEYFDLNVSGTDIVKGKRTPIGSDYDGLYLGLKGGGTPPAGIRSALWLEANQKFTKLARDKGFAWGFHGFSRDGFEFTVAAFHAKIWEYVAEGLPAADAVELFGYQPAEILEKMTFGQYAVKVTKEGATVGPLDP